MRTMYDSITAADIPPNGHLVAGYIDGQYKWRDSDWSLFPHSIQVRIATSAATDDGAVLDVENGDATPDQVPAWLTMRRASGADPSCYVNLSNVAEVLSACSSAGVASPHLWLAHYDGIATVPDGYVAKQYADPPLTGGHYDASAVLDYWPGVDNVDQFVTKAEFEQYKVDLETEMKQRIKDAIAATTVALTPPA